MYEYRATMIRVVDGDTVRAELDLGIDIRVNLTIRLAGINAPELSTPEGVEARQELLRLLPIGWTFTVKTIKDRREKYGRYLGQLFIDGMNVNDHLVASGHAATYP